MLKLDLTNVIIFQTLRINREIFQSFLRVKNYFISAMQYLLKFLQQLRFDFSTKRDLPQFIFFRFTSNTFGNCLNNRAQLFKTPVKLTKD